MSMFAQFSGITGIILLLYGLIAQVVTQVASPFFWILIVLGAILMLIFLATWTKRISTNPAELRDLFHSKNVKSGAGAFGFAIVFLFMVLVANIVSQRFYHYEKDLTENQVHTLADQTVKKLESLNSKIEVKAFFDERNQDKEPLKELLTKFTDHTKNLSVEFVDPDKERIEAQKYNAKDGDILFASGSQNHTTREATEEGLMQALLKITQTSSTQICFTTGHGELKLEGEQDDPRSASFLKGGLENDGYQVKTLELISVAIPADCGIVVIAGPEQPFVDAEKAVIDQYLEQGGKLLALIDPNITKLKSGSDEISIKNSGLEAIFQKWGVNVGKNIVLEKELQLFAGVQISPQVRAAKFGDHPIVDPLKSGKQVVFDRASSIQKLADYTGTAIELVYSSGNGATWAQSDVDSAFRLQKVKPSANDIQGPVSLAVYSEKEQGTGETAKKTQLVVVGDSDFASNAMIRSFEFNFDFILNALNQMSGDVEKISIRPKMMKASALELTPEQSNLIFYVAILLLPMLVLIFGINLWWYRRQRA